MFVDDYNGGNMKKKKVIYNLLIIFVLFMCIFQCVSMIELKKEEEKIYMKEKEQFEVLNNSLNEKLKSNSNDTNNTDIKDLEYYKKYYSNNDIVGTLKIENTDIYTLLVKSTDNDYYLNHSLYKKHDETGSIFVDYRTDFNSNQINIYGHNSTKYDLMFKELEKYLEQEFYKNHKYIHIWTGSKTMIYEIFSVQIVTNDYEHMIVSPKDRKKHIEVLSNSIYQTDIEASENDELLILQTCIYNPKNSFLIVNAKKIKEI